MCFAHGGTGLAVSYEQPRGFGRLLAGGDSLRNSERRASARFYRDAAPVWAHEHTRLARSRLVRPQAGCAVAPFGGGPGGAFTKQQMRTALSTPQKEEQDEQLDRRMRDLRPEGWVITTYREDRTLNPNQLRLVTEGGAVWQPGYRSLKQGVPTAKQRQATFAADDYRCRFCGIGAGEPYPWRTPWPRLNSRCRRVPLAS